MARLMQTYKELHPHRIAKRYGVTDEYVRQLWLKYNQQQMAPLAESLETFYGTR